MARTDGRGSFFVLSEPQNWSNYKWHEWLPIAYGQLGSEDVRKYECCCRGKVRICQADVRRIEGEGAKQWGICVQDESLRWMWVWRRSSPEICRKGWETGELSKARLEGTVSESWRVLEGPVTGIDGLPFGSKQHTTSGRKWTLKWLFWHFKALSRVTHLRLELELV